MPDTTTIAAKTALRPVAGRGKMTPQGYQPENHRYLDTLTEMVDERRVSRDPGTISLEALSAAGHPTPAPYGARSIVSRMNEYGVREETVGKTRLTGLRERYCYPCRPSEGLSDGPSMSGIRNCDIIDCPCWPYRLGFNPHNPQRGINPFAGRR
jgi:hypothetical protein